MNRLMSFGLGLAAMTMKRLVALGLSLPGSLRPRSGP
jgi:hypothetical protein